MCSGTGQDSPRSQTLHLNLWSCLLPPIIVCNYDIASICWQTGLKRSLTGEATRPDTGEGDSLPRWWRCLVVTIVVSLIIVWMDLSIAVKMILIRSHLDHHSSWFASFPPEQFGEISKKFAEIEFNLIFYITSSAGHSTLAMSTVCKPLKF